MNWILRRITRDPRDPERTAKGAGNAASPVDAHCNFPTRLVKSLFRFVVFRLDSRLLFSLLLFLLLTYFYSDFLLLLYQVVIAPLCRFLGEITRQFLIRPLIFGTGYFSAGISSVFFALWPSTVDETLLASRLREEIELRRAIGEEEDLSSLEGNSDAHSVEETPETEYLYFFPDSPSSSSPSIVAIFASFLFSSLSYLLSSLLSFLLSFNLPLPSLPSSNPLSFAVSFLFRRPKSAFSSSAGADVVSSAPQIDATAGISGADSGTPLYLLPVVIVRKIFVIVVNIRFDGKQPITMLNLVYLLSRRVA